MAGSSAPHSRTVNSQCRKINFQRSLKVGGSTISPVARYAFVSRKIQGALIDRKSTRLNSSHLVISYAVFCLKKKKDWSNRIESKKKNSISEPMYTVSA